MVATVAPIAEAGISYYENEGYYADNDPEHKFATQWFGQGAEVAGLTGHIEKSVFDKVLQGYVPNMDIRLGRKINGEFKHQTGLDVTFNAPKSVSMVALLGGREEFGEAHDMAVAAALTFLEKDTLKTRIQDPETKQKLITGNQKMVVGLFRHEASRSLDPHLHTHSTILNMVHGEDGKWRSMHNKNIYYSQKLLGLVYRNELASRLKEMGFEIQTVGRNGLFELKGFDRDTLSVFSKRSEEILAWVDKQRDLLKKEGVEVSEAVLMQRAILATRGPKQEPNREKMHELWHEQAKAHGIDIEALISKSLERKEIHIEPQKQREAVGGATGLLDRLIAFMEGDKKGVSPETKPQVTAKDVVQWGLRHLSERQAGFRKENLLEVCLARNIGSVSFEGLEKAYNELRNEGIILEASNDDHKGLITTSWAVADEKYILAKMESMKGVSSPLGEKDYASSKTAGELGLTEGQKKSLDLMWGSSDRVVAIQGHAGSGKTTMLRSFKDMAENVGHKNLLGLAGTGRATNVLAEETGMEAQTIQHFLAKNESLVNENEIQNALRVRMERLEGDIEAERGGVVDKIISKINEFGFEIQSSKEMELSTTREQLAERVANYAQALADYQGKVLIVDEASFVDTTQMRNFLDIVDVLKPERVALVGDVMQLPAVGAGAPFEQLQKGGLATAVMDEILRQRDMGLKASVVDAIQEKWQSAFERLGDSIIETDPKEKAQTAIPQFPSMNMGNNPIAFENHSANGDPPPISQVTAEAWLAMPHEKRIDTGIIVPTHEIRNGITDIIRTELKREGLIGGDAIEIGQLKSEQLTDAEKEVASKYEIGKTVEFFRGVKGVDISAGELLRVVDNQNDMVSLAKDNGDIVKIDPSTGIVERLEVFSNHNAELQAGDEIRWTATDRDNNLYNTQNATVTNIDPENNMVTLLTEDEKEITLPADAKQLRHTDYAFTATIHGFQGQTVDNIIIAMPSAHPHLTSPESLYVALSRPRDGLQLITEDSSKLVDILTDNSFGTINALDITGEQPIAESYKEIRGIEEQAITRANFEIEKYYEAYDNGTSLSLEEFDALHAGIDDAEYYGDLIDREFDEELMI